MSLLRDLVRRPSSWIGAHRRESVDLGALALALALTQGLIAEVPLAAAACAAAVTVLVRFRTPDLSPGPWADFVGALPRRLCALVATGGLLAFVLNRPLGCLWFAALWPVLAWALVFDWGRLRIRSPAANEALRIGFLGVSALWLLRGFANPNLNGTPDAQWYGTMLADLVAQERAGVFPVWIGQSVYQFNGSIYPLRVAPAFHHLGGLLDLLTLRSLGAFALQNLLLVLVGMAAMGTAYASLRSLLPKRQWLAAGLAALFLSCPGVLGIAYNTDLYMSWTTLPAVPLVWYATVKSFRDRGAAPTLTLLGAALGFTWWGHTPIALWSTLIAGAAQVARLTLERGQGLRLRALAWGAAAFSVVAAYPVGSVLLFPTEPGLHSDSFQRATAGTITYFLSQAYPSTFLPLSLNARSLGDFQAGYALWAVFLVSVAGLWRLRLADALVPLAASAVLGFLLLPIPHVSLAVWGLIPDFVRDTTGNWVMNRLYLPLAASIVFGAAAYASARRARLLGVVVAAGCAWSFFQASHFAEGSRRLAHSPDSAVDLLRPENVQITRFAYLVFPALPGSFTHGVADPQIENRLLGRSDLRAVVSNTDAAFSQGQQVQSEDLRYDPAVALDRARAPQDLHLADGQRYLLAFDFVRPDLLDGVLQLKGPHFLREYLLPEYGEARSFGIGGQHARALSVWSTSGDQSLQLQYFPTHPFPAGSPAAVLARVRLIRYEPAALPVQVEGWIPYHARVTSPADAWLETPRMYQVGYHAEVDGRPAEVRKSPDGLVCVAVPRGTSQVTLAYTAPLGLAALYAVSLLGMAALLALGVRRIILHLLAGAPPAAIGPD